MNPRSIGWRLVGATTAVLTVLAGLVSMDHHAESRHEICEEHGELIHVDSGAGTAAAPSAEFSDEQPIVTGASESEHGEHCSLEWSAPQSPQLARLVGQAIVLEQASKRTDINRTAPRVARRYQFAPKTSPPA